MLSAIGATLPAAVAIAVSPVPIIAVILMLMSPLAIRLGSAFLCGWSAGILLVTSVFAVAADSVPSGGTDDSQPVLGGVQLVLGTALLLLGWRQWRSRPAPGESATLPAWMTKIDGMTVPAATGLGFVLAALNPKNLLVAAAAGASIGSEGLQPGELAVVLVVFSALAAASVLTPVTLAALAPRTAAGVLAAIRLWLTENNPVIMMVLFLVLGANVLGNGIGSF